MRYFIIFIISLFMLYSCEKTITIKIDDKGRKLVVNSIFEADSVLKVHLSESQYILTGMHEYAPVNNATILLLENDTEIQTVNQSVDGFYEFSPLLKQGNNYKIVVSSNKYSEVMAESTIPLNSSIEKVEYELKFTADQWSQYIDGVDFKLHFNDRESEANYYLVQVYGVDSYVYYNSEINDTIRYYYINYLSLNSYDPSVVVTHFNIPGLLFNDELFDGDMHSLSFYTDYFYYGNSRESNKTEVTYYVVLNTLSKELYNYYLSYSKYAETVDNPFAEPVKVFNNIENGFGIFAGSSIAVDSVLIEYEYPQ